jgi:hypothetical protein
VIGVSAAICQNALSYMEDTVQPLIRPGRLWSREEILQKICPLPNAPGTYAWYFNRLPPAVPEGPYHAFEGGWLLYVGISPRPPPKGGQSASRQTVAKRLRYHYRGNAEGSTLRLTLGCLLATELDIELRRVGSGNRMTFGPVGELRLSEWMGEHTRVACVACESPWDTEHHLIANYSLPLNLDQNKMHPYHLALSALRREARLRARNLPVLRGSHAHCLRSVVH